MCQGEVSQPRVTSTPPFGAVFCANFYDISYSKTNTVLIKVRHTAAHRSVPRVVHRNDLMLWTSQWQSTTARTTSFCSRHCCCAAASRQPQAPVVKPSK